MKVKMPTPQLKGPGLLLVNSKITRPDILDEEMFINWYSADQARQRLAFCTIDNNQCHNRKISIVLIV
jgi:hypothetical protein